MKKVFLALLTIFVLSVPQPMRQTRLGSDYPDALRAISSLSLWDRRRASFKKKGFKQS